MLRIASGVVVVMLLIGCKVEATDQPAPTAAPAPATTPAADEDARAPTAGQVACHLDCSGQERTAYGATEEQARAAARQLVEATCRPEDGQFFIFCDPAPAE